MKSLLFHAFPSERNVDWQNFLREVADLNLPDGTERLAEGVWLLPADDTYVSLSRACRRNAIGARCVEIVHKASWQNLVPP